LYVWTVVLASQWIASEVYWHALRCSGDSSGAAQWASGVA